MNNLGKVTRALHCGQAQGFRGWADGALNGIAGLESQHMLTLLVNGNLGVVTERDPDTFEVVMDGLTLVFFDDDELFTGLVEYGLGLERFVAGAYLAEYDSERDMLSLISSEPLSTLLRRHATLFRTAAPALDAVLGDGYKPPPINELANYSGQHYVCDYLHEDLQLLCGERLCESHYCWIEDDLCLIYLELSGSNWHHMRLYPFRTRVDAVGMEKIRASEPLYRRELK